MTASGYGNRFAIAVGVVAIVSAASLAVFFVVGDPFGAINDVANAVLGVGCGWLALTLRSASSRGATGSVIAATTGAVITVMGSGLIVSSTTGFFLAGLVSSVGFGLIGVWVVALNRDLSAALPRWLSRLGVGSGSAMALGLVAIPGVIFRLDDFNSAPVWIWIALVSWLGVYVLLPVWAILLGRPLRRGVEPAALPTTGTWCGSRARRRSTRSPRNGTPSRRNSAIWRAPIAALPSARTTRYHGIRFCEVERTRPTRRGAWGSMSP